VAGAPRRWVILGTSLVVLIVLTSNLWRLNVFDVRAGSVATAFDPPPGSPGYTWTWNGRPVSAGELYTFAGPAHCGWQSATMLFVGWPPGTASTTAGEARQYIRDPNGVFESGFRGRLARNATVPADARPTGYRYGAIEIYLSPSDQDEAIYLVSPSDRERWPRSDPKIFCA
jgi:hypothetical protein